MKINENRDGIHVLDDSDLEKVGARIAGGFEVTSTFILEVLSIAGIVLAAVHHCMNPTNRQEWYTTFMSNFNRQTVADTTHQADLSETGSDPSEYFDAIESVLDGSQSDSQATASVLAIAGGAVNGGCG
jgi:hypothetical protein